MRWLKFVQPIIISLTVIWLILLCSIGEKIEPAIKWSVTIFGVICCLVLAILSFVKAKKEKDKN